MNVNAACRQNSKNPTQSIPRHLACAETWAGNDQTASSIELPGLTAWVHSVPVDLSHAGGDVHLCISVPQLCRLADRSSRCERPRTGSGTVWREAARTHAALP